MNDVRIVKFDEMSEPRFVLRKESPTGWSLRCSVTIGVAWSDGRCHKLMLRSAYALSPQCPTEFQLDRYSAAFLSAVMAGHWMGAVRQPRDTLDIQFARNEPASRGATTNPLHSPPTSSGTNPIAEVEP